MAAKTDAEVIIDGKVYTLSGYEEEEYLQKVANYINNKISEFDSNDEMRKLQGQMRSTLIELNIADDYFKVKDQMKKLENDVEEKDKEMYNLKHEIVTKQCDIEKAEKVIEKLRAENKELLLNKARLEKALEEQLLDCE
ncbi:cell division protein ZapA [Lachnospiraceae bacterium C7]|nr:cell division protein ZapA [Lachnospiraceae bacterium C7]